MLWLPWTLSLAHYGMMMTSVLRLGSVKNTCDPGVCCGTLLLTAWTGHMVDGEYAGIVVWGMR